VCFLTSRCNSKSTRRRQECDHSLGWRRRLRFSTGGRGLNGGKARQWGEEGTITCLWLPMPDKAYQGERDDKSAVMTMDREHGNGTAWCASRGNG
jgi:hypothetical protein